MNITATIDSDPPILSLSWGVEGGDLPPHAKNYTNSDRRYSILELRDLCYSDSGNYTITATNEYGTSEGYALLQISKGIAMSQLCCYEVECYVIFKPHHEEDIFVIT